MPKNLCYDILITNTFTGEQTSYQCNTCTRDMVDIINRHYGMELLTINSLNNLITRKRERSPKRLDGIVITRQQQTTIRYPHGVGGEYPPVKM